MSLVPPVDEEHVRDLVINAVNTCNATVCEKYKDSKHVDVDIRISGRPDIIRLASPDPLADFLLGTLQGKYDGANDLLQGQVTPESFAMCHLACRRDDKKLMKIVSNHIGPLSDPWMNVALSSRSMKVAKYLLIYPTTEVWEIAAASNFIDFLEYIRTIAPIPALPMGLSCAAFSGDAKAVQYMFDCGARDLNEALCVACRHYYSDVMDLLMQLGADDCANCKNSLHWLCRKD
jgi:hypothetical protein